MTNRDAIADLDRRAFLAAGGAGALALTALEARGEAGEKEKAKLPQKALGQTGVKVPLIGLGTAPAGFRKEKEAVAFYNRCIDVGLTYLDSAPESGGYGKAQKYLGEVLKTRRKEVFVITKCHEPDGEKALKVLKQSLAELQIERADLVYAHSIGADKMDPKAIYAKTGVCKALDKAKKDGLTRFVGVSGHNRPGRFLLALKEWKFDVMMNAVSIVSRHIYDFESKVWPEAAKKKVALAAMKVFGGAAKSGVAKGSRVPDDLKQTALRYALGLPQVSVVVVGIHDDQELKQNLAWLKAYKPLTDRERDKLERETKALAAKWGDVYGPVA
jgi:aryl-alcohol dehydrogenase-like predicted oxidoreductase